MRQNSSAEQASAERASWLMQLRLALQTASDVANDLLDKDECADEARRLLNRMALIRSELDSLQRITAKPYSKSPARLDRSLALDQQIGRILAVGSPAICPQPL